MLTPEGLSAFAGMVLSLLFSYVPKLSDWFAEKDPTVKRLLMAAMLLVVAAGAMGLSCANLVNTVACSQEGLLTLIGSFISALVANQATFQISPQKKSGGS